MLNEDWYTEVWTGQGAAISLKLRARLHDERSPYQRIEVYDTEHYGRLLTLDGLVMVTGRDNFIYHEMLAHPALLAHPAPARVLIIGGGDCGTLTEVLKHTAVQRVDQVELDERVTRVAERFFPELCASNTDPRAHLHFADGVRHIASAPAASYEVILVDSTDPVGPAAALFSEAFYRDCARALTDDGVLALQSESPLYHPEWIVDIHARLQQAGFAGRAILHFPQGTYPSGWWSVTLARRSGGFEAPREENLATRYFSPALYAAARVPPRFLADALARIEAIEK